MNIDNLQLKLEDINEEKIKIIISKKFNNTRLELLITNFIINYKKITNNILIEINDIFEYLNKDCNYMFSIKDQDIKTYIFYYLCIINKTLFKEYNENIKYFEEIISSYIIYFFLSLSDNNIKYYN